MMTPIVVGPICASFGLLLFWPSPYLLSKWSVDQDTIPQSDTRELQNSSLDETNTSPKPFWRLLSFFFSIPRGSWCSEKTTVQDEIWDTSMTASPICGAPASLRRRGRQGVRHSASMRDLTMTDTIHPLLWGWEKKWEIRIQKPSLHLNINSWTGDQSRWIQSRRAQSQWAQSRCFQSRRPWSGWAWPWPWPWP